MTRISWEGLIGREVVIPPRNDQRNGYTARVLNVESSGVWLEHRSGATFYSYEALSGVKAPLTDKPEE